MAGEFAAVVAVVATVSRGGGACGGVARFELATLAGGDVSAVSVNCGVAEFA